MSLGHLDPNPVNWTHIYRISRKIGFFDVKCQKMAFSPTTQNYVLVEISTSLEISTVKFFRQKLVRFSYTPYKYLSYCFITLENIQKVDFPFSFRPHSRVGLQNTAKIKDRGDSWGGQTSFSESRIIFIQS